MPGSGGTYIKDAVNAGADVMITGDIDHHEGIDAVAQGITVIDPAIPITSKLVCIAK